MTRPLPLLAVLALAVGGAAQAGQSPVAAGAWSRLFERFPMTPNQLSGTELASRGFYLTPPYMSPVIDRLRLMSVDPEALLLAGEAATHARARAAAAAIREDLAQALDAIPEDARLTSESAERGLAALRPFDGIQDWFLGRELHARREAARRRVSAWRLRDAGRRGLAAAAGGAAALAPGDAEAAVPASLARREARAELRQAAREREAGRFPAWSARLESSFRKLPPGDDEALVELAAEARRQLREHAADRGRDQDAEAAVGLFLRAAETIRGPEGGVRLLELAIGRQSGVLPIEARLEALRRLLPALNAITEEEHALRAARLLSAAAAATGDYAVGGPAYARFAAQAGRVAAELRGEGAPAAPPAPSRRGLWSLVDRVFN
ncbi:MAG: hypothetical protein HY554_01805 [Elusimicrobia bacterium]|nr:hypothetical protein [Elusimicrobiota bacterium]